MWCGWLLVGAYGLLGMTLFLETIRGTSMTSFGDLKLWFGDGIL